MNPIGIALVIVAFGAAMAQVRGVDSPIPALERIQTTLDRIEKKLDDTNRRMTIGKCDLDNPHGTAPLQRKASFQ